MAAAKVVLEPIFEGDFRGGQLRVPTPSLGPPGPGGRPSGGEPGAVWVLDADIKACFDEIDHDARALVAEVQRRVSDRQMVKLLRSWLRAGVFEGGVVSAVEAGTPQGSPISPLLANIALHVLDEDWVAGGWRLGTLIRYADDLVVLCATKERAEQAKQRVAAVLRRLGLRLHPDKTRIVHLVRGAGGFDFLGFHNRMQESRKWRGRWYLHQWPSDRAMASIRAKIRAHTTRGRASLPLEMTVERLNLALRGWGAYFRRGNSSRKFAIIDCYVNQWLAMLASVKHGLRGWNWTTRFTHEWANNLGIHRLTGTVRYGPAHA